jgi:hypothetical protein
MHDSDPYEMDDAEAKRRAHTAYLSIAAFRQDQAKGVLIDRDRPARGRLFTQNKNPSLQAIQERPKIGPIHSDEILTFVPEFSAQDSVHNIPIIRQKNQPRRILIESADRKDALGIVDRRDDVAGDMGLGGTRDSNRFVVGQIHGPTSLLQHSTVYGYHIAICDLVSERSLVTINRDPPFLDQPVGRPARAKTLLREELIDAHGHYFNRFPPTARGGNTGSSLSSAWSLRSSFASSLVSSVKSGARALTNSIHWSSLM